MWRSVSSVMEYKQVKGNFNQKVVEECIISNGVYLYRGAADYANLGFDHLTDQFYR